MDFGVFHSWETFILTSYLVGTLHMLPVVIVRASFSSTNRRQRQVDKSLRPSSPAILKCFLSLGIYRAWAPVWNTSVSLVPDRGYTCHYWLAPSLSSTGLVACTVGSGDVLQQQQEFMDRHYMLHGGSFLFGTQGISFLAAHSSRLLSFGRPRSPRCPHNSR